MANIIDAWKKLGKKLTGKDITGTNLVNVIDDIADNYEGGGSGGGGSDDNIITMPTLNISTILETPTIDQAQYEELEAAFESGKEVKLNITVNNNPLLLTTGKGRQGMSQGSLVWYCDWQTYTSFTPDNLKYQGNSFNGLFSINYRYNGSYHELQPSVSAMDPTNVRKGDSMSNWSLS